MMTSKAIEILLAEDDEGQAFLVQRNLERAGITNRITHVVDGQQALDFVHRQGKFAEREEMGPLLLILDINMPFIDGVEVLTAVRADQHTTPSCPSSCSPRPTIRVKSNAATTWAATSTSANQSHTKTLPKR